MTARELPILFSAPMIRAILANRKTQTRRILKPTARQVEAWNPDYSICPSAKIINGMVAFEHPQGGPYTAIPLRWRPGDTLWVRETWAQNPDHPNVQYNSAVCYRANPGHDYDIPKWRPSIFMPRWASRITLAVEAVAVERLQEITSADALAEGIQEFPNRRYGLVPEISSLNPVDAYARLWNTINGPGAWDANPWVSVTTFRRIKT